MSQQMFNPDTDLVESREYVESLLEQQCTMTSFVFFSKQNMALLQNKLRNEVYKQRGVRLVVDQSHEAMVLAMRAIFTKHAVQVEDDVKGEIKYLNQKLVDELVPMMVSNMDTEKEYNYMLSGQKYMDGIDTLRPIPTTVSKMSDPMLRLSGGR